MFGRLMHACPSRVLSLSLSTPSPPRYVVADSRSGSSSSSEWLRDELLSTSCSVGK